MTRIVGSKRPQEVITTTSWRDGQANVKRILNAKKAKISDKQSGKTEKPPAKSEKASVRAEKGKQICCQRHPATDLLSTSQYQDAFAWLATVR